MPRPEFPDVEARADWLAPGFAEPLERVRAELATWVVPELEADPVLLEYQRRAAFGLADPVAPLPGDDRIQA